MAKWIGLPEMGTRCQPTRAGSHVFNRTLLFQGGSLPSEIPAPGFTEL